MKRLLRKAAKKKYEIWHETDAFTIVPTQYKDGTDRDMDDEFAFHQDWDEYICASINDAIQYCVDQNADYVLMMSDEHIQKEKTLKFNILFNKSEDYCGISPTKSQYSDRKEFDSIEEAEEYCKKWGHEYEIINIEK